MNRNPLAARTWELLALVVLLGAYLVADALFDRAGQEFMNLVGPIWFAGVLSLGALAMTRADPATLWTALFWFRVSSAVYFGFGAAVPVFATPEQRAYMETFFRFFSQDMAKANLIFTAGALTTLLASNAGLLVLRPLRVRRDLVGQGGATLLAAGLLFLAVGFSVKYLFVLPYSFGLTDFVLPGSVSSLGRFTLAAIFLLTAWSKTYARGLLPFVAGFVALDMTTGALLFYKAEVLGALMTFLMALMWPKVTPVRLGVMAGVLGLAFVTLVPIVNAGRAELVDRYGMFDKGDIAERFEILSRAVWAGRSDTATSRGMTRLSYTNQATFAVNEYDAGRPGQSFANVLAVFVPRALWPEKPIITQVANDFNALATRNPNSASSPGFFAEAYWNFGWAGVILVMPVLGAVLAALSQYTLWIIRSGRWFYFPVVLLALRVGFRTDGLFVIDVAGAVALAVALHILLMPLDRAFAPETGRCRATPPPWRSLARPGGAAESRPSDPGRRGTRALARPASVSGLSRRSGLLDRPQSMPSRRGA